MIVTRRRRKKRNWTPIAVTAAAVAAVATAFAWPPAHAAIAEGPLKPAWSIAGGAGARVARPLTFAAQQQHIADQQRELNRLNASLEADRKARDAKEARIAELQVAVARMQAQPKPTPVPAAPRQRASAPHGAAADAPEAVKRTAAYWASMDAEKAAAVAQRLPDDYVNRVFAQMPPDAVADIMNALPARNAARLAAVASAR